VRPCWLLSEVTPSIFESKSADERRRRVSVHDLRAVSGENDHTRINYDRYLRLGVPSLAIEKEPDLKWAGVPWVIMVLKIKNVHYKAGQ
jgi:hypothetical protein